MQKRQEAVVNGATGHPVQGAIVTVTTLLGVAATIYTADGTGLISGNTVTTDSNGRYFYYAADGRYTETITGSGIVSTVITDILLEDPVDGLAALSASGGSALISFLPSGTGPTTRLVSDTLNTVARSGDYASSTNYLARLAALTETLGVARLNIQQTNGIRYQTSTGYGPMGSHTQQSTFNGTIDNILMFASYNVTEGTSGTKVVAAEPLLAFQLEADYNNGAAHLMELNLDYTSPSGGVSGRRFLGFNVDRATDLGAWALWGDTMTFLDSTNVHTWFNAVVTSTAATIALSSTTRLGIGTAPAATRAFEIRGSVSGTQQYGGSISTTFSSGATGAAYGFTTELQTAAAVFTIPDVIHWQSQNITKGAGSIITNQTGFWCSDLTSGASNYGFRGLLSAGGSKYNLLMDGTAQNYLAGVTGIGVFPSTTTQLLLALGTTAISSLRIPHGAAPTSPVNGDIWTTTAGLFVRVNGATVGPLT